MRSFRFFILVLQCSVALLAEMGASGTPPAGHVHVWRKFVHPNATIPEITPRIHGGQFAQENAFPFMVFLMATDTNDFLRGALTCSASLIHEEWVLTAAHCVLPRKKPPNIFAVAGRADLRMYYMARVALPFEKDVNEAFFGVQERRVRQVHVNPEYTVPEGGHDLALLHLDRPFELNDAVATLPLSKERMSVQESCTVLGWGLDEFEYQSFRLLYAQPVYAQTPEINCTYQKHGPVICLEKNGGGICRGDSGSPLVCRRHIWGVASYSVSLSGKTMCADQEEEYFSQIHPDIPWINKVMGVKNAGALHSVTSVGFLLAFVVWLCL